MSTGASSEETTAAASVPAAVAGPPGGEPTVLGLPCFIAGSASFGLAQAGVVPAAAAGAALPVILGFSAVGIFLTTIWAASIGRNVVATVFGIFGGFWLSYGALLLGTLHGWFGVAPASVQAAKELYLVVWLVVIVTLTLTTLRLHLIYTAVFFFVDLALLLVFLGVNEGSAAARCRSAVRSSSGARRRACPLSTGRGPWVASHEGGEAFPVVGTGSWVDLRPERGSWPDHVAVLRLDHGPRPLEGRPGEGRVQLVELPGGSG
jgi:succinate-acetate transporter protein